MEEETPSAEKETPTPGEQTPSSSEHAFRAVDLLDWAGLRNGGVPASTPPEVTAQAAELGSRARAFSVFLALPALRTGRRKG